MASSENSDNIDNDDHFDNSAFESNECTDEHSEDNDEEENLGPNPRKYTASTKGN